MSNYDDRNIAQIRIDEMINKYKTRSRETEYLSQRFETDREIYKSLITLINDLKELKQIVDKLSIKGGKLGNKN